MQIIFQYTVYYLRVTLAPHSRKILGPIQLFCVKCPSVCVGLGWWLWSVDDLSLCYPCDRWATRPRCTPPLAPWQQDRLVIPILVQTVGMDFHLIDTLVFPQRCQAHPWPWFGVFLLWLVLDCNKRLVENDNIIRSRVSCLRLTVWVWLWDFGYFVLQLEFRFFLI